MNFQYDNNTSQYTPPQFSIMPTVCKNLLIINVLCYLATIVLRGRGIDLSHWFGLHMVQAEDFRFWQPITYAFFHGNFSHLFFNMFAVWMFGYTLENIWGAKRFIVYCIATILGAALAQEIVYTLMYSDLLSGAYTYVNTGYDKIPVADYLNEENTIGASGMVFGLLAAFGLLFPNTMVYLYFLFPIKTKWFVIGYMAIELFNGIFTTGDGVAHFAHLGGALAGVILLWLWKKKREQYRY